MIPQTQQAHLNGKGKMASESVWKENNKAPKKKKEH
jgi:hypothetical protein